MATSHAVRWRCADTRDTHASNSFPPRSKPVSSFIPHRPPPPPPSLLPFIVMTCRRRSDGSYPGTTISQTRTSAVCTLQQSPGSCQHGPPSSKGNNRQLLPQMLGKSPVCPARSGGGSTREAFITSASDPASLVVLSVCTVYVNVCCSVLPWQPTLSRWVRVGRLGDAPGVYRVPSSYSDPPWLQDVPWLCGEACQR